MALVKRPGSAENRLEWHEPSAVTDPQHLIDLSTLGAPSMAKKASKTGTYKIGDDYFHFVEGDEFPAGAEDATFVEPPIEDEEGARAKGAAPENKARGAAPENR